MVKFVSIIFFSILALIFAVTFLSIGDTSSSPEIDSALKRIALNVIKEAVDTSKSIEEAAEKVGVDPDELGRLCYALDIDIDFAPPKVEPVPLLPSELLSNSDYDLDVILSCKGNSPYVLLVDKTTHNLHLLHYNSGKRTLIETFKCKTGKNPGDKMEEGDHKTPEGVFFLVNKYSRKQILEIVGKNIAYQYGEMAFATNFPNYLNRIDGKNGSGIWLHGTDEDFDETSAYDTRGCVVVTNETIKSLSKYIELQKTPLIIEEMLKFSKTKDHSAQSQKLLEILEGWRSNWEIKQIDEYIQYYSPHFKDSKKRNLSEYKNYKASIFNNFKINHIKLDDIIVFKHNDAIIAQFIQDYSASNIKKSIGLKTLYLVKNKDTWKIIGEKIPR
ncbi:murein L,D-transpeptidase family protein [Candidatus Latescibacterota bacterium]